MMTRLTTTVLYIDAAILYPASQMLTHSGRKVSGGVEQLHIYKLIRKDIEKWVNSVDYRLSFR